MRIIHCISRSAPEADGRRPRRYFHRRKSIEAHRNERQASRSALFSYSVGARFHVAAFSQFIVSGLPFCDRFREGRFAVREVVTDLLRRAEHTRTLIVKLALPTRDHARRQTVADDVD